MKKICSIASLLIFGHIFSAAEVHDWSVELSGTYEKQLETAANELVAAKPAVMEEKAPMFQNLQELESQIRKLEAEIEKLELSQADQNNESRMLESNNQILKKMSHI